MPRLERPLYGGVIGQTAVSDVDNQQNLIRARRRQPIIIGPRLQHSEIGFRLGAIIELNRILHGHHAPVAHCQDQPAAELIYRA